MLGADPRSKKLLQYSQERRRVRRERKWMQKISEAEELAPVAKEQVCEGIFDTEEARLDRERMERGVNRMCVGVMFMMALGVVMFIRHGSDEPSV
ncbi:MAG: hypothetical protein ACKVI4_15995 [Actinomycetales bacterium]|tara:strand:- start:738 stop:1022 length:285 start_codon:yes stop_codon:yes gene_type:complete